MLRAVAIILTLMWGGLLAFPALADFVGLAGIGALLVVLGVDRVRKWRGCDGRP
jgi:hypothetical protein